MSNGPVSKVSGGRVSVSTCPMTGMPLSDLRTSGVHVSHVRVRLVGAVVGSWSELVAGQSALGRPGRGRPRTVNHAWVATTRVAGHLVGWHRNPPWVASSGQPVTPGSGGTRPGSRTAGGLCSFVREGCMASHETLSSEWIGCDHAQWSSREASGRAAGPSAPSRVPLRPERAAVARPHDAVSAVRPKLTAL
jgi:hypothetical protein